MSSIIARTIARVSKSTGTASFVPKRTFHSPFAALGNSHLASSSAASGSTAAAAATHNHNHTHQHQHHMLMYEKQLDASPEPFVAGSGARTYHVSEPEPTSKFYEVPSGAYPVATPFSSAGEHAHHS